MSPSLFNVFINDIPELLHISNCDPVHLGTTKVNCLLYADDLVLLSQSRSGLRESLAKLENYVERWRLEINIKKFKVLIFGSKFHRSLYSTSKWYLCGELLQNVDEYVYLGITFHYSGRFKAGQRRYRDYFMVGECVRFLFTSCEGSLNERVSAANE